MTYNIFKDKRDPLEKMKDPNWLYAWWVLYGLATAAGIFISGFTSVHESMSGRLKEGLAHVGLNWPIQFLVFTAIMATLIIIAERRKKNSS
ncbi:hypothetical protein O6R08_06950 [Cutibacterium equinum]|uniref:Uncharacterized protein n=1 Tax=Cutibacterium equinum TaxID=3016342 RepID=A0ABY7QXJ6_9ACTN|nr:hypothetical protein [Cutibacterium equinum]WCC79279.1 hypothetical protein O6R08_06950 [Cutibacterium equinum]